MRTRRIFLEKLVEEPLLIFWIQVPNWDGDYHNPFCQDFAESVMMIFEDMDKDSNGVISAKDLASTSKYPISLAFADQICETLSENGEMTFGHFVRFKAIWENAGSDWANTILFEALDIDKDGLLTRFEINYFHRELAKMLKAKVPGHEVAEGEAVMSENFDMCQSSQEGVTKENFIKSLSSERFVRAITDFRHFAGMEVDIDEDKEDEES
jgi:Ca2+-binding EF-hand superfamily protein